MPGQMALIRPLEAVFQCCAAGEADHAVFGGVVCGATGRPTSPPSEEQFTIAPLPCVAHLSRVRASSRPRRLAVDG